MQGLLLRFLETGELQKVGADRVGRVVNVRVIAATNRNLRDMIAQGQFREDLFYRLNVIHFWRAAAARAQGRHPAARSSTSCSGSRANNGYLGERHRRPTPCSALTDYAWPGNVRELENVIERLVVTGRHEHGRRSTTCRRRSATQQRRRRSGRSASAAGRWPTTSTSGWSRTRESFWTAVYPLYMQREITRGNVRDLVRKGLEEARGNYKIVAQALQHGARATTSGS